MDRRPAQDGFQAVGLVEEGKLGGQFANYSEISVKRQVTRDGQSKYSLNNARCRKRDVADLFLGTGLGPRSYAIIEQGMISRLIEAKPEELRIFIEEAAGISKPQIHVLSRDDAGVARTELHQVEPVLRKDVVHGTERGALVGLGGAAIVLLLWWHAWRAKRLVWPQV